MRQVRRRAAQALRAGNEWSSEVNEVLDFFETVGLRGCMACRSWSVSQYLSPGRLRRARSRPHPPRLLLRPLLRGVELDQVVALHGEAMARGRAPCWRLCGPGDNAVYSRRWNATFVADSESTPARASKRPGGRACSTRRNASGSSRSTTRPSPRSTWTPYSTASSPCSSATSTAAGEGGDHRAHEDRAG